jgi:hypothetical protein
MHPKIIEAVKDKYRGGNQAAINRAKRAGTFELILVSLGNHDLLSQILNELQSQRNERAAVNAGE